MSVVDVNLGEVSGVVKAGTYLIEIETAEMEKQANGPVLVCRASVVEPEANKGQAHFERITIGDEKFGWVLDRWLNAAGIETPTDETERKSFSFDTDDLIGKSLIVVLIEQSDNPEYTNTRGVYPASAAGDHTFGAASSDDEEAA